MFSRELNSGYWVLRTAFGLGPLLAGLDKFTNILVNWEKYLNPRILQIIPISATTFMHLVGVIEIVAGLAVLPSASRIFCSILTLLVVGLPRNLVSLCQYYETSIR